MKSKLIRLVSLPQGIPIATEFKIEEEELPPLKTGQLLLKTHYISVDPYLRAKMAGGHKPPLYAGDVMYSRAVAEVIATADSGFRTGDKVIAFLEWRDYLIQDGISVQAFDPRDIPLSAYLGVFGSTGLSAYFALTDIGAPRPGKTLVVSGAAGAVGSIAGQIGKLMGCRVIGIAGTDKKVDFITSELGFDAAINYKNTSDMAETIDSLCPGGVDIYFDNVGGSISDAVISRMNDYGRVVVCGSIAGYNVSGLSVGPRLLPLIVFKKLLIQGFLISDYKERYQEGIACLQQWVADGKLHYTETILEGFERLPEAFIGLFTGINEGKMIVSIV